MLIRLASTCFVAWSHNDTMNADATNRSLQNQLYLLIASLIGVTLLGVVIAFSLAEILNTRSNLLADAKLIAQGVFGERQRPLNLVELPALEETLGALRLYPIVRTACVYDANGLLMAQHFKVGTLACDASNEVSTLAGRYLHVVEPILWRGQRTGSLVLYADERTVWHSIANRVIPMALVGLLAFVAMSALGGLLLRRTLDPLNALTVVAKRIDAGEKSVRVAATGSEETVMLAHTFNRMIDELQETHREADDELRQRRFVQNAMKDAELQLERMIDGVPYPLFAVRPDGSLLFANAATASLYGQTKPQLSAAKAAAPVRRDDGLLYTTGEPAGTQEIWFARPDAGTLSGESGIRRLLVTRTPIDPAPGAADRTNGASLVVALDVTDQRRTELLLEFVQRLDTARSLAGDIAHDFNNLLAPVMAYTTLLLGRNLPQDVHEKIEAIYSATLKARSLVHTILSASGRSGRDIDEERRAIAPATLIEGVVSQIRSSLPDNIELKVTVADALPEVFVNPGQLQQVIVNLCENARQALRERTGSISVSAERSADAGNLCFEVTDNGRGMNPLVLDRIFDPFFTTEDRGPGTGLGLSVVRGIVEAHRGTVTVESEEGAGTTVRVYLPVVDTAVAPSPAVALSPVESRSHTRVLLVDDEATVLRATTEVLESLGFRVQPFASARAALDAYRYAASEFDIVVADNLMPGMTGVELARALRRMRAAIPVLLMTGYPDDNDVDPAIDRRIMKPASASELSDAIRQVVAHVGT